jgi:drug/metabolite transporter (DMT)-like permease
MYLVPVATAALGAAFLGEAIAAYHLVGGALIVVGVAASTATGRAGRGRESSMDKPKPIS